MTWARQGSATKAQPRTANTNHPQPEPYLHGDVGAVLRAAARRGHADGGLACDEALRGHAQEGVARTLHLLVQLCICTRMAALLAACCRGG